VSVTLTGDSELRADFNVANYSARMRSEMLLWPVKLAILVIALGSLVAAGLPLMLTMAGLLVARGLWYWQTGLPRYRSGRSTASRPYPGLRQRPGRL
jgi:uncharacterized membrane protein YdfJ with MMPL/SSD domain